MKVAITGSSGLVGRALAKALQDRNDTVLPVVRRAPQSGEIGWDINAGTIDSDALAQADAVVHLAGEGIGDKRWSAAHKARVLDSRVNGTKLLAEAMAGMSGGPTTLLSGSAIGFYGDRGDEVLTEQSPRGDGYLSDVCVAWEDAAAPAARAGIRTAFLRTGIVMAGKGGVLGKQLPLFKLGLGGVLLPGDQYLSWISLTDEVGAILWALDNELDGPLNLTGPTPVTNREFTKTLGEVLGRPTIMSVPQFAPRLLLGKEMADNLLNISSRVEPDSLVDSGYTFSHSDLETALRAELGK